MTCRERLEHYLRDQQVAFAVQQHPMAYTSEGIAATEHIPGRLVAKVVIGLADENMVMLVLPASSMVDEVKAADVLGARGFRLAHETDFAPIFPDCEIGAMPPFGNLYNLPVYVDKGLTADESVVFCAGTHSETMRIRYADWARLVGPTVADFARPKVVHTSEAGGW